MQARYRNSLYVLPSSIRTDRFVIENPHFIWIYPRKKRTPAACAFFFLLYGKLLVSGQACQAKKDLYARSVCRCAATSDGYAKCALSALSSFLSVIFTMYE